MYDVASTHSPFHIHTVGDILGALHIGPQIFLNPFIPDYPDSFPA